MHSPETDNSDGKAWRGHRNMVEGVNGEGGRGICNTFNNRDEVKKKTL